MLQLPMRVRRGTYVRWKSGGGELIRGNLWGQRWRFWIGGSRLGPGDPGFEGFFW